MVKKILLSAVMALALLQGNSQSLYDTDLLSKEFHKLRREALRQLMPPNSVAVFFTSPVRNRANDVDFLYHQNPDLYYLSGYDEPNAVLLIFKEEHEISGLKSKEFMFVQDRDPKRETWTGRRMGKDGVKKELGIDGALLNTEFKEANINFTALDQVLVGLVPKGLSDDKDEQADLYDLFQQFKEKSMFPEGNTNNQKLFRFMAMLRQEKQPEELQMLRKAISITCASIKELMRALEPDMTEYQAQAIVEYEFKRNGSEYPGYPSIVGAGENSCTLHYETNRKKLESKDIMVADVGAEYHGYTADVTRTMPARGKFSEEQKVIYGIVLEAQEAGIKECRKGKGFRAPGAAATAVIKKRLLEKGIIKKEEEYTLYFPHGTSHYLGLDVHDTGLYDDLKPGDVLTVEPGIYIPANSACDPKWWNIGVRIEDDILITETGCENLSEAAPRQIAEIEKLMAERSRFNNASRPVEKK